MPLEEILKKNVTGIDPFNELPIDAEIWREAHAEHQSHQRLHAALGHRAGIVYGLEVFPVAGAKTPTVRVARGLAIDGEGRPLMLSTSEPFEANYSQMVYITILYQAIPDPSSALPVAGGEKCYRKTEHGRVVCGTSLPTEPYVELARIDRTSPSAPIQEASDPFYAGDDEINLLFRPTAFPHCYADGGIGELCFVPKSDPDAWSPNRAGLMHLLRHANANSFHLDYIGLHSLTKPSPKLPLMLYVAGGGDFESLSDAQVKGLKAYLDQGGTLLADACGNGEAFFRSVRAIAEGKDIGAKLKPVSANSRLLSSHHIFGEAPPGAARGELLWDEQAGLILSGCDYGGAWQGRVASRETIRTATDFGTNIVAFAARRQRRRQLGLS